MSYGAHTMDIAQRLASDIALWQKRKVPWESNYIAWTVLFEKRAIALAMSDSPPATAPRTLAAPAAAAAAVAGRLAQHRRARLYSPQPSVSSVHGTPTASPST